MTSPLWTVAEVARAWRVSKMTVYRLIASGELASIRVGRSYRIPPRAVMQLEQKRKKGTL